MKITPNGYKPLLNMLTSGADIIFMFLQGCRLSNYRSYFRSPDFVKGTESIEQIVDCVDY